MKIIFIYLLECAIDAEASFILDTSWSSGLAGWTGPRPDIYINMEDISMYQDTTTVTIQDDMVIHLISNLKKYSNSFFIII